jgi:hypothetical protein
MPDEAELNQARQKLADHGGYDWLLEGQAFWSVTQVVEELANVGMQISNDSVARWFRALPHTQDFGGRGGLRASKNDLILYFAGQMGK